MRDQVKAGLLLAIILPGCFLLLEVTLRLHYGFEKTVRETLKFKPAYLGQTWPTPSQLFEPAQTVAAKFHSTMELYPYDPPEKTYGKYPDEARRIAPTFRGHMEEDILKVWNYNYLKQVVKLQGSHWAEPVGGYLWGYGDGIVNAFKPYDDTPFPVYRYLPYSEIQGTRFNRFGLGGTDLELTKKRNVIRVAFLGASTTQQTGCLAYPDYIEEWLNRWSEERHIDASFEVINAARVGQRSMDALAILKYEVLPLQPDLVLYYEGRNQMNFDSILKFDRPMLFDPYWAMEVIERSVLLQQLLPMVGVNYLRLIEDLKPRPTVDRMPSLAQLSADPGAQNLPANMSEILSNLASMDALLDRRYQTFVLSSFAMLADDRFWKDSLYAPAYAYWLGYFHTISLADIGALNAYENRLFRSFASFRAIPFIEVAEHLTKYPAIFRDGIHLNCVGMKLHAWIVFLQLLPIIQEKIATGVLPHHSEPQLTRHPYLGDEPFAVDMNELSKARGGL